MQKDDPPIIVQQTFRQPAEKVWQAITDVQQMVRWYFDNIPDFRPQIGFKTQFMIKNEGREFLHLWEVTQVIPNRLISYSWQYRDYPGLAEVTFESTEGSDHSTLSLTNIILESFPQAIPEFKRESCIGGGG